MRRTGVKQIAWNILHEIWIICMMQQINIFQWNSTHYETRNVWFLQYVSWNLLIVLREEMLRTFGVSCSMFHRCAPRLTHTGCFQRKASKINRKCFKKLQIPSDIMKSDNKIRDHAVIKILYFNFHRHQCDPLQSSPQKHRCTCAYVVSIHGSMSGSLPLESPSAHVVIQPSLLFLSLDGELS